MEDKIVDDALNLLKNNNDFSTHNMLHLVYQKFEENDSLNSSEICKKENNDHSTILNGDDGIVKLCSKIESILKKLKSICSNNNGLSDNKCCDYLIYGIYGELMKGNYTPYSVHWLYGKIQVLLESDEYGTKTNLKCNSNFKRVFDVENLKIRNIFTIS
ncbi:CYIR protein [Plasmodium cynomolgi strain B]|uniref:CYIR protein n=1 Tax=Plasmodium cynomolgi (strain B) TaxID=1120755 RepID=K6UZM0_PLACD|nr:CYIR protein [Plasmodium cynomolgi strain B]GAB69439.1 CYIR protein [Plasmodium cynomolgi strain B]